jgi:hypothetical protein
MIFGEISMASLSFISQPIKDGQKIKIAVSKKLSGAKIYRYLSSYIINIVYLFLISV